MSDGIRKIVREEIELNELKLERKRLVHEQVDLMSKAVMMDIEFDDIEGAGDSQRMRAKFMDDDIARIDERISEADKLGKN